MTRARRLNRRLNCVVLASRRLLSGYYVINASSGKVLGDPGYSKTNGTGIIQWQWNVVLNCL
jgi:hypothetical protein